MVSDCERPLPRVSIEGSRRDLERDVDDRSSAAIDVRRTRSRVPDPGSVLSRRYRSGLGRVQRPGRFESGARPGILGMQGEGPFEMGNRLGRAAGFE